MYKLLIVENQTLEFLIEVVYFPQSPTLNQSACSVSIRTLKIKQYWPRSVLGRVVLFDWYAMGSRMWNHLFCSGSKLWWHDSGPRLSISPKIREICQLGIFGKYWKRVIKQLRWYWYIDILLFTLFAQSCWKVDYRGIYKLLFLPICCWSMNNFKNNEFFHFWK